VDSPTFLIVLNGEECECSLLIEEVREPNAAAEAQVAHKALVRDLAAFPGRLPAVESIPAGRPLAYWIERLGGMVGYLRAYGGVYQRVSLEPWRERDPENTVLRIRWKYVPVRLLRDLEHDDARGPNKSG
jgi:hypothetical protein